MKKLYRQCMFVIFCVIYGTSFVDVSVASPAPYLANYYLNELYDTPSFVSQMAQYDLLILSPSQIAYHPSVISAIKQKNSDIIILAYVPSQSYNYQYWPNDIIFRNMKVQSNWWLRSDTGSIVSTWQGIQNINMTEDWSTYLVNFVNTYIVSLPYVDGIFFDMVSHNIAWANGGNIDMNNDGKRDSAQLADTLWLDRSVYLLNYAHKNLTADYIIINGTSHDAVQPYVNGRMFETFPTPWVGDGTWSTIMNKAAQHLQTNSKPHILVFNSNTNNGGNNNDYKKMRFGLSSSLLEDNIYFSFDHGDQDHGQLWWYDEYNVDLGNAIGSAESSKKFDTYKPDVWRRDFENGLSLVNSDSIARTVDLGGEYEKIHGTQDTKVNDGSIISKVDIQSQDGLVLLKTFETLNDVIFTNGSFVRFLHPDGSAVRNGFFAFEDGYRGGYQLAHVDVDNNSNREFIVIRDFKIEGWRDDGVKYFSIIPYTANYTGSLNVAIGDLFNTLFPLIFVAPSDGHKGPIKIYTRFGDQALPDFYPFGKEYSGGYSLAVGDVDGGADTELIVGRGGDMTRVYVYDKTFKLKYSWVPFESWFLGGANVAVGNTEGDYMNEVIVGPRRDAKPVVKVFDGTGKLLHGSITVYNAIGNPGIDVRSTDVDFDGYDDIIGMSESAF